MDRLLLGIRVDLSGQRAVRSKDGIQRNGIEFALEIEPFVFKV